MADRKIGSSSNHSDILEIFKTNTDVLDEYLLVVRDMNNANKLSDEEFKRLITVAEKLLKNNRRMAKLVVKVREDL